MTKGNSLVLLIALVGLGMPGLAEDRAAPNVLVRLPIYIRNITVIDTKTGKESEGRTVVLSGKRIATIKADNKIRVPAGARVIDGTAKYLITGLWDMHPDATDLVATDPLYLANDVTGVREMSGPPDANRFRQELTAKKTDSPHMYIGSPIVDGPPPAPDTITVTTPAEA